MAKRASLLDKIYPEKIAFLELPGEGANKNVLMQLRFLKIPLPLNKLLRSHWSVRYKETKEWKWYILAALGKNLPQEPYRDVDVEITIFKKGRWDKFDNLPAACKLLIDALVQMGVLAGDTGEGDINDLLVWQEGVIDNEQTVVKIKKKGGNRDGDKPKGLKRRR